MDDLHSTNFLWPAERELLQHFVSLQNEGFTWDNSEWGHFREDFFPPVEIPVVAHTPWVKRNIPIPPGIYDEVSRIIRIKMDAGVYERSNSSYCSRWFCIIKKDMMSLRLIHSPEPLNAVTIQHSGITPFTKQIAEQFAGCACSGILNLYIGYDERMLAPSSHDYMTFQTPYGALRLTKLPMGWMNAVPIFHDNVTHILQPEVPKYTILYIDNVLNHRPVSTYQDDDRAFETILENSGIRHFIWEHFQNVNRIVQCMKYSGGTFSGKKSLVCTHEITVVGHVCTPKGRVLDPIKVDKIVNWGPCADLSEVCTFLGMVGVIQVFIKNFAHLTHLLTSLMCKDLPFVFGLEQISAQDVLQTALLSSPALRPIDYASKSPVIKGVDTSSIAVGYLLCQCDADNPHIRHYACFSSITLNDCELRFSQPKLELYGLFHALHSLKMYLIGVRNLIVEVNAQYIKGMLSNPDIVPSANVNCWIISILLFHFTLVHVPGTWHRPNGLSRCPQQLGDDNEDLEYNPEFNDWVDKVYGFMHFLNPTCLQIASSDKNATFTSEAIDNPNITNDSVSTDPFMYDHIPHSEKLCKANDRLDHVCEWFTSLRRPDDISNKVYAAFLRYCTHFFIKDDRLWKKDLQGPHGDFVTCAQIIDRFWWPKLATDVAWFVKTCHLCQLHQTHNILILPVVATPTPLFMKMYMDKMHLPKSGGFKYLVQGHCSLTHYPEYRILCTETMKTIGDWIFDNILCQWGALCEIIMDNSPTFVKALDYLGKQYHIHHI